MNFKKIRQIIYVFFICVLMAGCGLDGKGNTDGVSDSAVSAVNDEPVYVYIVRHGKTWFNTVGITQGWCDSMLTDEGQREADAVGAGLADTEFIAAYSSDLGRQRETANRILTQNQSSHIPELQENIGFREASFGSYEGCADMDMMSPVFDSFNLQYGQFRELFQQITAVDLQDIVADNDPMQMAEHAADIQSRMVNAIDTVVKEAEASGGGNVLVVSSGSSISVLMPALDSSIQLGTTVNNCSVSVFKYEDGVYTAVTLNDMSYMESGAEKLGYTFD